VIAARQLAPGRFTFLPVKDDSVKSKQDALVVTREHGFLKGQFDPNDPYVNKLALIRIAQDVFAPAVYDDAGVIYEVFRPDLTVEFTRENGRGLAVELRDDGQTLQGRALRTP
jgi:hypothetical protein